LVRGFTITQNTIAASFEIVGDALYVEGIRCTHMGGGSLEQAPYMSGDCQIRYTIRLSAWHLKHGVLDLDTGKSRHQTSGSEPRNRVLRPNRVRQPRLLRGVGC
jgi:hypothetical protein